MQEKTPTFHVIKDLFDQLDLDKNHLIDKEEFVKAFTVKKSVNPSRIITKNRSQFSVINNQSRNMLISNPA